MSEHPDNPAPTAPFEMSFWYFYTTLENQRTSTHVVPHEEFVHCVDQAGSCVCGPIEVDHEDTVKFFRHWPLDARYYEDDDDEEF